MTLVEFYSYEYSTAFFENSIKYLILKAKNTLHNNLIVIISIVTLKGEKYEFYFY